MIFVGSPIFFFLEILGKLHEHIKNTNFLKKMLLTGVNFFFFHPSFSLYISPVTNQNVSEKKITIIIEYRAKMFFYLIYSILSLLTYARICIKSKFFTHTHIEIDICLLLVLFLTVPFDLRVCFAWCSCCVSFIGYSCIFDP